MKKLVTMFLVAAVSLSCFTACGGKDDQTGKGEYTYRGTYSLQPAIRANAVARARFAARLRRRLLRTAQAERNRIRQG